MRSKPKRDWTWMSLAYFSNTTGTSDSTSNPAIAQLNSRSALGVVKNRDAPTPNSVHNAMHGKAIALKMPPSSAVDSIMLR